MKKSMIGQMKSWRSEPRIPTSLWIATSSEGGRFLRCAHLMATFLRVARCVPKHTVAKAPDLIYYNEGRREYE